MNMKIAALLSASFIGTVVFVGCSCSSSVDNDTDDMQMIAVGSDVTASSDATTTTTTTVTEDDDKATSKSTSRTSFTYEIVTGESYTTSKSVQIHYVGDPNPKPVATTAATHVVIVTVTTTSTTVATTTTEPPLVTQNMPDGLFSPESDLKFTADYITAKVGDVQNGLASFANMVADATPVHGGVSATAFYFGNDYHVISENMTKPDGSEGDFITEVVIKSDKVCTNKGITIGSSMDDVYAAYGTEKCVNEENGIYRYRTDDGYVLEFTSDGASVTGIRYFMAV